MSAAKSNITVAIETTLLRKARALAARHGCSVSALLENKLHELIAKDGAYESAHRNARALLEKGFSLKGGETSDRDAAHDRRNLR